MADVTMEGVLKGVAIGTSEKVRVSDFINSVFINRPMAGGEMHRRLLWLNFLMLEHVKHDFPTEEGDLNRLAVEILNVTESTVLPCKDALTESVKTIGAHKKKLKACEELKKMNNLEKKKRHAEIRRRGDMQRAQERKERADAKVGEDAKVLEREVDVACEELRARCAFVPEQVLLAFHQTLSACSVTKRQRNVGLTVNKRRIK